MNYREVIMDIDNQRSYKFCRNTHLDVKSYKCGRITKYEAM